MKFRPLSKATLFLAVASLATFGLTPMANADTFTPENDPPVVDLTAVADNLQPANPRSTTDYVVKATIGSQGTAANLKTVTMCWYHIILSADPTCADAASDPKHEFLMTWTQSTNSYTVTGTNNYRDAGSSSDYGDGSGLALAIEFKFKISNAMLAGSEWGVRVVAIDDQDQSSLNSVDLSKDDYRDYLTVNYFGAVTTQRSAQDFGNIGYGGTSNLEGISTGSFIANGSSYIGIAATDFKYGTSATVELTSFAPGPGEAALVCQADSGSVILSSAGDFLDYGLFGSGTGESAVTNLTHDCSLSFGGGASVANVQYSNTVTISIGSDI